MPAVAVEQVERHFTPAKGQPIHAVGPVSLDIGTGEFVCLVGPSGCGKSTLLRMVAGLTRPSTGRIGLNISPPGKGRQPLSMVFQDYGIYPWKTVEANVRFGLDLAGVPRRDARARVDHWLGRMRLSEFRKAYPDTLSGGMKQRVSIARALAVEPELLLMDEPFAALDAQLRQVLQDELLELWQSDQRTVLFVTHSLDEALVLGDRVLVMSARPGQIIADIRVPFERPRRPEVRADPRFGELREQLWSHLRAEVAPEDRDD